ncbi:MAG: hypothetical protein QM817_09320 [Archangium sp.]
MAREASASAVAPSTTWGPWLFGPRRDLAMVSTPIALLLLFFALSRTDASFAEDSNRYAMWLATNVLGNGTHVILTFLLFWFRPETMRSTPTLRAQVWLGVVVTLLVSSSFYALHRWEPQAAVYARSIVFALFGTHHTLSQNRGYWSLYLARERSAGLPFNEREGKLQRLMVPLTLGLLLTRYFFVARSTDSNMPFVGLGIEAPLPYAFVGALLAIWLGYWVLVFRAVLPGGTQRPKLLYLFAVALAGSVSLLAPTWGVVLFFGMHGLEYYFLSERMLTQLPDDKKQLASRWIWPAMVLSMLPIFLIGVVTLLREQSSFSSFDTVESFTQTGFWAFAVTLSTACVLAHYWADALIYRFRLPDVRKVMLARIRL